jgi:hypothetical protein
MESNSDDDSLELPKQKATKETIDALKSLQKEKKTLPKKPMSEARQATIAKMRAAREANCKLRAEAKALLLKNKESIEYTKEQKKAFKKKELEELKVLLGKNKEQEVKSDAEPKQTNKPKKVIEKEESETESEEEITIVKKKSKPKAKTKKKVTVYLSSDSDDESESDNEPPPPKQPKSRIQRPNQIEPVAPVAPAIDYKSFFC